MNPSVGFPFIHAYMFPTKLRNKFIVLYKSGNNKQDSYQGYCRHVPGFVLHVFFNKIYHGVCNNRDYQKRSHGPHSYKIIRVAEYKRGNIGYNEKIEKRI